MMSQLYKQYQPLTITISIQKQKRPNTVKTMNQSLKPKIVFILGGPGSGKGTQSDIMINRYGFLHLSTGDLLREFIKTDCEQARKIKELLDQGKLAPSPMLVDIIKRRIFKDGPNDKTYLIDGFPRSAQNFQAWQLVFGDTVQIITAFYLQCTLETLEVRLLDRAKTSGRSDDNINTIRKRFQTYAEQTKPFMQLYKRTIGEVNMINGEDSIEVVSEKIREVLVQKKLI